MEKRIKLKVLGITYSQIQSGAYALVLAEENGTRRIPIIIGTAEAQSIAIQLEHLTPPRPLTHDLFVSFAKAFGIKLKEVYSYKFEDGVFNAELVFEDKDGQEQRIDSRTSDAIAFALRTEAVITTTEDIIEKAGIEFEEESEKKDHSPEFKANDHTKRMEELHAMLNDAVKNENYEEASRVRDEIKKLKDADLPASETPENKSN
ncbi:MAG: bifunctional nuclease domain-containing protein [Bacteroidales bacterium]